MQLELTLLPPKKTLYRALYGGSVHPSVWDMMNHYLGPGRFAFRNGAGGGT